MTCIVLDEKHATSVLTLALNSRNLRNDSFCVPDVRDGVLLCILLRPCRCIRNRIECEAMYTLREGNSVCRAQLLDDASSVVSSLPNSTCYSSSCCGDRNAQAPSLQKPQRFPHTYTRSYGQQLVQGNRAGDT
jgi:hypothetical protein